MTGCPEKTENRGRKPMVIIVSSPSGGGKTTIVKNLLRELEGVRRSVSYTTRKPRVDEKDTSDYTFISEKEFRKKIDGGELVEWEKNFGNYYGTPMSQIEKAASEGYDIILSIDVKGARQVKKAIPESVSVFILPPSTGELAKRLKRRNTEKEKELEERLSESGKEMAAAKEYDYQIINRDLDVATRELRDIIEKERNRRKA